MTSGYSGTPLAKKLGIGPGATIATLNALLWILALRGRSDAALLVTALFPVLVFLIGTAVASASPAVAQFAWCVAFLAPFAGWLAGRRVG